MNFWEYVVWFLQHLYVLAGALSIAYVIISFFDIPAFLAYRNLITGPVLNWDRYLYLGLDVVFIVDLIIRGTKQIRIPFTEQPGSEVVPVWSVCFVFLAISFIIKFGLFVNLTIQGFKVWNRNRLSKRPKKVKGAVSND